MAQMFSSTKKKRERQYDRLTNVRTDKENYKVALLLKNELSSLKGANILTLKERD